mmetsp:Transcript_23838/g.70741  ORF Transcript_23838/g.70741 Transcript_23838/m.70741 type:complete len:218 (+) Transcript_23838:666-1319(+)
MAPAATTRCCTRRLAAPRAPRSRALRRTSCLTCRTTFSWTCSAASMATTAMRSTAQAAVCTTWHTAPSVRSWCRCRTCAAARRPRASRLPRSRRCRPLSPCCRRQTATRWTLTATPWRRQGLRLPPPQVAAAAAAAARRRGAPRCTCSCRPWWPRRPVASWRWSRCACGQRWLTWRRARSGMERWRRWAARRARCGSCRCRQSTAARRPRCGCCRRR